MTKKKLLLTGFQPVDSSELLAQKLSLKTEQIKGYADGFRDGFKEGLKANPPPDIDSLCQLAFHDGIKHIVMLADGFLAQELKLPNREALSACGKIPAWWIATLINHIHLKREGTYAKDGEQQELISMQSRKSPH